MVADSEFGAGIVKYYLPKCFTWLDSKLRKLRYSRRRQHATKTNYSAISNRESCEVSPKTKTTAETRRGAPAATAASAVCGKARRSPYLRETACDGSKEMCGPANPPAVTQTGPLSGEILRAPPRIKDRPGMTPPNAACTFVDSVISLCSKSLASCVEMSAPVPREDMFLLLVRLCGVREARYWAETLGFKHQRSYALLSNLLCGEQFSNAPNMIC